MSGLLVVVHFGAVYRLCFLASCSPLGKDPLVFKLHCVGLQPFGEREGAFGAEGSWRFGTSGRTSCFF